MNVIASWFSETPIINEELIPDEARKIDQNASRVPFFHIAGGKTICIGLLLGLQVCASEWLPGTNDGTVSCGTACGVSENLALKTCDCEAEGCSYYDNRFPLYMTPIPELNHHQIRPWTMAHMPGMLTAQDKGRDPAAVDFSLDPMPEGTIEVSRVRAANGNYDVSYPGYDPRGVAEPVLEFSFPVSAVRRAGLVPLYHCARWLDDGGAGNPVDHSAQH